MTFKKEGKDDHLPEGSDHRRDLVIWVEVGDSMVCPQQLFAILPPGNMGILVRVGDTDGAVKLDALVFRKYYVPDRVIKCKRRKVPGPGRGGLEGDRTSCW